MNSLCKTAKTLDTVFQIAKILLLIACIASAVAAIFAGALLLLGPDLENFGFVEQVLELGAVRLSIAPEFELPVENVLCHGLTSLGLLLVVSVFGLLAVKYIRNILTPMTEGEPFRSVVARNLKKLAWLSIVYTAVRFFLDGLESFLFGHFFGDTVAKLIEGSGITHISYDIESDMSFLLVAGVLFLLSYVFRYAEELQKLSDETL